MKDKKNFTFSSSLLKFISHIDYEILIFCVTKLNKNISEINDMIKDIDNNAKELNEKSDKFKL